VTARNWERVRRQDAARAGRSNAEIELDREDEWFEREMEREYRRSENVRDAAAPKPQSNAASKKQRKRERLARQVELGRVLRVAPDQLEAVRKIEASAASAARGSARERQLGVAKRLGLTEAELKLLRNALSTYRTDQAEWVASIVRRVLATQQRPDRTSDQALAEVSPLPRSATRSPGAVTAATQVYVVRYGRVVHLDPTCHNMRGFRRVRDDDPDVYRVQLRDASCRGRAVCKTCGIDNPSSPLRRMLVSLHGPTFTDQDWKATYSHPKPRGDLVSRGRRTDASASVATRRQPSTPIPRSGPKSDPSPPRLTGKQKRKQVAVQHVAHIQGLSEATGWAILRSAQNNNRTAEGLGLTPEQVRAFRVGYNAAVRGRPVPSAK
jgi:hypothetical protein